jgi:hypothetical protein
MLSLSVCAIKFFHASTDIAPDHAAAKKEANMRKEIYGSTYGFSAESFAF